MLTPTDPTGVAALVRGLDEYREARKRFLRLVGVAASNRDPLAEFSERLVQSLLGGDLASSRVQPYFDLTMEDGRRVQVRYLANSGERWVNEHLITRISDVDLYALVIYEDFCVAGVLVVPCTELAAVGALLGKRHGRQDETLQFTRRNWSAVASAPQAFTRLGVLVWVP